MMLMHCRILPLKTHLLRSCRKPLQKLVVTRAWLHSRGDPSQSTRYCHTAVTSTGFEYVTTRLKVQASTSRQLNKCLVVASIDQTIHCIMAAKTADVAEKDLITENICKEEQQTYTSQREKTDCAGTTRCCSVRPSEQEDGKIKHSACC